MILKFFFYQKDDLHNILQLFFNQNVVRRCGLTDNNILFAVCSLNKWKVNETFSRHYSCRSYPRNKLKYQEFCRSFQPHSFMLYKGFVSMLRPLTFLKNQVRLLV